jgi:UDP-glucose 4-epimerase
MLKHQHHAPVRPSRVVVLGSSGFIGGATVRRLRADGIAVVPLGRNQGLDLLAPGAADLLAATLRAEDALVFVSAKAPCKNASMLLENLRMAEAVTTALAQQSVAHVVYVSSDAVYKDSSDRLKETSCAEPGSLHGVMHLAREVMLRSVFAGPLALVRPTLVYGLDDPHNGYGPNRFRRLAAAGKEIALFGEGEERRDHVFVEDIAELIRLVLVHRSDGVVNAVSGDTVSFRALAEFIAGQFDPRVEIRGTPRTGPMPHNGYRPFAPSVALEAFHGFRFQYWRDGLAALCAQTPRTA